QRATTDQSGQPPSWSIGSPLNAPIVATVTSTAAAPAATKNCIDSTLPCPAEARLQITSSAMPSAVSNGSSAPQPSSITLGRSTTSTPAKATATAIQVARRTRSPSSGPLSSAAKAGATKLIATATVNGSRNKPQKKP